MQPSLLFRNMSTPPQVQAPGADKELVMAERVESLQNKINSIQVSGRCWLMGLQS